MENWVLVSILNFCCEDWESSVNLLSNGTVQSQTPENLVKLFTMVKSEHTLLANEMNQLASARGNQGVIDGLIANNCDNHLNT